MRFIPQCIALISESSADVFATTAPHALMYSVVCGFECDFVLLWLRVRLRYVVL